MLTLNLILFNLADSSHINTVARPCHQPVTHHLTHIKCCLTYIKLTSCNESLGMDLFMSLSHHWGPTRICLEVEGGQAVIGDVDVKTLGDRPKFGSGVGCSGNDVWYVERKLADELAVDAPQRTSRNVWELWE